MPITLLSVARQHHIDPTNGWVPLQREYPLEVLSLVGEFFTELIKTIFIRVHPLLHILIVCSLLVFIHLGGSLRRLISPHINLWRAGVPRRGNTATTVIMRREISITALIHRATLREHHTEITPTSTRDRKST